MDAANNMRCAFCDAATPTLHTYDGDHMRVQSTDSGVTTQYLHNHQGLLLQTLVPGAGRQEHIYLGRRQVARRVQAFMDWVAGVMAQELVD